MRGWGKPAEDLLQGYPDSEKAAVAARWAIDLKADRQFGGGAERDRNLDAGNAGVAVGVGVLDKEQKVGEAARVRVGGDGHFRRGRKRDCVKLVLRERVPV